MKSFLLSLTLQMWLTMYQSTCLQWVRLVFTLRAKEHADGYNRNKFTRSEALVSMPNRSALQPQQCGLSTPGGTKEFSFVTFRKIKGHGIILVTLRRSRLESGQPAKQSEIYFEGTKT
jgi:hypothetical protein